MKFRHTQCFTCMNEKGFDPTKSFPVETEYDDSGRLTGQCDLGHKFVYIIQSPDHCILFELAIMALLDGYNREAVATFATALERYYEAVVKGILIKNGLSFDSVDNAWKPMSKQSERQLGAFIGLFSAITHQLPILLTNSETEKRNDCVHRGRIPSKSEALSFGARVHKIIQLNNSILKQFNFDLNDKYIVYRLTRIGAGSEHPVTVGLPLSIERVDDFESCLKFVNENRSRHWTA